MQRQVASRTNEESEWFARRSRYILSAALSGGRRGDARSVSVSVSVRIGEFHRVVTALTTFCITHHYHAPKHDITYLTDRIHVIEERSVITVVIRRVV